MAKHVQKPPVTMAKYVRKPTDREGTNFAGDIETRWLLFLG